MKYLLILLAALAMFVSLFAVGCSDQEPASRTSPLADSLRPDTETRNAKIDLYDKDRRTTQIQAGRIVRFEAKDSTMGYQVHADFFDSSGAKVVSQLDGDSAYIRESTNHLFVYGHVVVVSDDSSKLETDYLHWNPDIKKIQTDAFVKITRRGDIATGWGLEADQKLTHIRILRQVSATVKHTEDMEKQGP